MKKLKNYIITTVVGLFMVGILLLYKDVFHQESTKDVFHVLTDAFFVPGVLITGFGLLVVANNGGTFDMISYGMLLVFNLFRSDMAKRKYKTFYDYRVAKSENKQSYGYFLIIGIGLIAISIIFLTVYSKL